MVDKDFRYDDIAGMASYIYLADKSRSILIIVSGFQFQCDPNSGQVSADKSAGTTTGKVNVMIAETAAGPYIKCIQNALCLAAKREMLEMIRSLNDPSLNAVIPHQPSGPNSLSSMSELLINSVLTAVMREVRGSSYLTMFSSGSPKTEQQKVVKQVLEIGIHKIRTYEDVQNMWKRVPEHLQPQGMRKPSPGKIEPK